MWTRRICLVALLLLGLTALLPAAAVGSPPNVLLVSIDTLRAMNLSGYGYERNTSPNIDELMASGVRFDNARTVEPLTAPALASMLTGLQPHEHGSTRNGLRVRPSLFSFTKSLGRRGYETAAFLGNWTLRDEVSGLGEHFETYETILTRKRWFGMAKSEATADDLIDASLSWLDQHLDDQGERPFVLWVHMVEPHAPYRLRKEFLPQIGVKASGSVFSAQKRYDSEIAFADDRLGRLLSEVFDRVDRESVVTIFFSDHGESLGEHGYWGHGRHLYEFSLRIPLAVSWPGQIEPAALSESALISDLPRTVLGLLGFDAPDFLEGYDWSGALLRGEPGPPERETFHQAHRGSVDKQEDQTRLRARGLLEVGRVQGTEKELFRVANGKHRIFDLEADPEEKLDAPLDNDEPSEALAAWLASVRAGLIVADDLPPPNLSDEDLEALRALGYLD
jgi:arylsulfatase A-like enzyme